MPEVLKSHASEVSSHGSRNVPSGDGSTYHQHFPANGAGQVHRSQSNQHQGLVPEVLKSHASEISSHDLRNVPSGDGSIYQQHYPVDAAEQVHRSQSNQHQGSAVVSKSLGSSEVSSDPRHVPSGGGSTHHEYHPPNEVVQVSHSQSNQFPGSSSDVSEYRGSSEASSTRCPRNVPSGEMIYQYYQISGVAQEAAIRQSFGQTSQLQSSVSEVSVHEEALYPPSALSGDAAMQQQHPAATRYQANQCQRSSSELSECHNHLMNKLASEPLRRQNRPNLVVEVEQHLHPNQSNQLKQSISEVLDNSKPCQALIDEKPRASFSSGTYPTPEHNHADVYMSGSSAASLNRCPRNIPSSEMIYSPSCSVQPARIYPVQSVASHHSHEESPLINHQAFNTQGAMATSKSQLPKQVNANVPTHNEEQHFSPVLSFKDQQQEMTSKDQQSESDRFWVDRVEEQTTSKEEFTTNLRVVEPGICRDAGIVLGKDPPGNQEVREQLVPAQESRSDDSNFGSDQVGISEWDRPNAREEASSQHSDKGRVPFVGSVNNPSFESKMRVQSSHTCEKFEGNYSRSDLHLDMEPGAKVSAETQVLMQGTRTLDQQTDDHSNRAIEDGLNERINRLAEALKEVSERLPPKDNNRHEEAEACNQGHGASPGQRNMYYVEKKQQRPPPYPTYSGSPSIHSVYSEGGGRKGSMDSVNEMSSMGMANQRNDRYATNANHSLAVPSREEFQAAQGMIDLMDNGEQPHPHFDRINIMGSPLHQMRNWDLSEKSVGSTHRSYEKKQVNTSFQGSNYQTLVSPVVMAGCSQEGPMYSHQCLGACHVPYNQTSNMYDMNQLNNSFQGGYHTLLSPLVKEGFDRAENLPFVPASARSHRSIGSGKHTQSEPRSVDVLHPIHNSNSIAIPISPITTRLDERKYRTVSKQKKKKTHSRRHRSGHHKHQADPPGRTLKNTDDEVRDPPDDHSAPRELRERHPKHQSSISPFRSKESSESHAQSETSKHAMDPPDSSEMLQKSCSIILNSTTPKSKGRRSCIDQYVLPVQAIDFSEVPLSVSKAKTPSNNRRHSYFNEPSNVEQTLLITNQEGHLFTDDAKAPRSQRQHNIFKPNSTTKEMDENIDSSNTVPMQGGCLKLCATSSWDDHEVQAPIQAARSFGESSLDLLFQQIDEIEDDFNTIVASIPGSEAHTIASSLKTGSICSENESVKSIANDKHALVEITLNNAASFESNATEGSSMVTDVVQRMRRIKDYIDRIDSVGSEGDESVHSIYSQDEMSELMHQLTNAAESLRALHTDWDD